MNSALKILFFAFVGFLLSVLVVNVNPLYAATKTSVKSGNWNDATVWDMGVPGTSDDVIIADGHTVSLVANVTLRSLTIQTNAVLEAGIYDFISNYHGNQDYIYYTNNGTHNATTGAVYTNGGMGVDGSGISNCNFEIKDDSFYFVNTCNLTINGDIYTVGASNSGGKISNSGTLTINGDMTLSDVLNYSIINQTGNVYAPDFYPIYIENNGIFNISGNLNIEGNGGESAFWNNGSADIGGDVLGSGVGESYFDQEANTTARFGGSVFPAGNEGNLLAAVTGSFSGNSAEPNTIEYYGSDQIIETPRPRECYDGTVWYWLNGAYSNLILSNSGIKTMEGNLTINGNLSIRNFAQLDVSNDGGISNYDITLKGDWINSGIHADPFVERGGKVIFSGDTLQSITASNVSGGETFYDLIINNNDTGIILTGGNVNVRDTLNLSDGLIHTGTDTLYIMNSDTAAIPSYSDTTYVNGYLKRGISPTGGNYDFPIGNATAYALANVEFFGPDTIGTLTVDFSNPTGGTSLSPLTDANDVVYDNLLNCGGTATGNGNANAGVWNIRPGKGKAIYALSLYGRHYNNQGSMYHSIVKRENSSSPWALAGTYLAAGLKTDTIIAKRTCLTDFYQFAIAESNTNGPLNTTRLSFTSNDSTICGSGCIAFTSKNNFSATSWRWTRSGGVFSSSSDTASQNPSNICFNTLGDFDVRLIASTACTADTLKKTQYVNVNPIPTAEITAPDSICSGRRIYLLEKSNLPNLSYLWSTGSTSQGINAIPLINTTFSVIVSKGSCKDTASIDIVVTPSPTAIISANKTVLCSNDSTLLVSTATAQAYLWSTGETSAAINVKSSDNYTLTLSNGNCFNSNNLIITVVPMPTASISGPKTICNGNETSLTASAGNGGGSTYLWNMGETSAEINITPKINTVYAVTVSNGSADGGGLCTDTASRSITLITPVPADAGPNITIAIGLDTVLTANNGTAWSWTPKVRLDCNTCQTPIVSPFQTTNYTVTVTDINGCLSSDSVKVYVIPCAELFVPKAFSPNNDGNNDVLYIRGTDCIDKILSFTIYNRWGEKVFETTDIKTGWDGSQTKQTKSGEVFIYYLDALSINGETIGKTGNVTLMK